MLLVMRHSLSTVNVCQYVVFFLLHWTVIKEKITLYMSTVCRDAEYMLADIQLIVQKTVS